MDLPDPDTWKRIDAVLVEALNCAPGKRAAFLDEACAGAPDLRAHVERLLRADAEAGALLEGDAATFALPLLPDVPEVGGEGVPADDAEAEASRPRRPLAEGTRVGAYRITGVLGEGGTSTVYRAERADGQFARTVALKVLHRAVQPGSAPARRLQAERQILASFAHPHVAQVYDGGLIDDERPYLALEHVEGAPLTAHCDAHTCSVAERLALFEQAARAVQAAHERLVVHRDLKPSNILVTERGTEGAPTVKLLDFGIAKLLGDLPGLEAAPQTRTGLTPMTPAYAAPEQVRGEAVTTAADTYALGVVLYELLAGRRPHPEQGSDPYAVARAVVEDDPPPPSTVAEGDERTAPLRGDLDAIVMKALRKQPSERYGTVQALLDDVQAHRARRPVAARQGTWRYRTAKFMRRHRWGVGVAAAFAVVLAGAFVVLLQQQAQTAHQRDRAQAEAAKARQVTDYLVNLFAFSDPTQVQEDTVTARELLRRGTARIEKNLREQPVVQAALFDVTGRAYRGLGRYDSAGVLLEQALAQRRRLPGDHRREVAASLEALAELRTRQREFAAADSLYREALTLRRALPDRAAQAEALDRRGRALIATPRRDEGEVLLRKALALKKEVHGARSSEAAKALWHLSYALGDDRIDEEIALLRKAITIEREQPDTPTPGLAEMLEDEGMALWKRDHAETPASELTGEEAFAQVLREAHAVKHTLFGPDNRRTIRTLGLLALLLEDADLQLRADRKELRLLEKRFGQDHPRLVSTLGSLAGALRRKSRLDSALAVQRRALRIQRRATPGANLRLIAQLQAVGDLLRQDGRSRQACPRYREVLALTRQLQRDTDAQVEPGHLASVKARWGACLVARGAYAKAAAALEDALVLLRPLASSYAKRTDRVLVMEQLTALHEAQGRAAEAAAWHDSLQVAQEDLIFFQ